MKRRTVIFTGKEKVELLEEPIPSPGPGQLLVETRRSLISTGTESTVYRRAFAPGTHWDAWVRYPFRTGYLSAGVVAAVGPGVSGWKVGDRVASRTGHTSHGLVNADPDAVVANDPGKGDCTPAGGPVRIPDGVSDDDACWMGLGKITQGGVRAAEHTLGESIAVVGLGLLGQLVVQYCRLLGAAEIIAIDTSERRLAFAAEHGATRTLRLSAADALGPVRGLTGGEGVDVVYDITGHPAVLPQALPLARRFGRLVLLGDAGDPSLQVLTPDVVTRGVRIVGVHDGHPPVGSNPFVRWGGSQMNALFMTYLARGQLRLADLITSRFAPEQAPEAFARLQTARDREMGVVFDW